MKKLFIAVVTLCLSMMLCATAFAAENSMDNFVKTETYSGVFTDVPEGYWAVPSIQACYEYGLMTGVRRDAFAPGGTLTVAQALVMADRVHELYTTGQITLENGSPWYQPYVDYAVEHGLISADDFQDYNAEISRADMARLFARSLPEAEFAPINEVKFGNLPDVEKDHPCAEEIYRLYNAGVLTGSDPIGTFKPDNTITRAETAAIISRVAVPDQRKTVSLLFSREIFVRNDDGTEESYGGLKFFVPADTQMGVDNSIIGFLREDLSIIITPFQGLGVPSIEQAMTPEQTEDYLQPLIDSVGEGSAVRSAKTELVSFGQRQAYRTVVDYENDVRVVFINYIYAESDTRFLVFIAAEERSMLKNLCNYMEIDGQRCSSELPA